MKKLAFIWFMITMISLTNAVQVCELYDDFSSETINTSKWEESLGRSDGSGLMDEHSIENQKYHTAQLTQSDKGVELKALQTISVGDIIEFDLEYNSASGNHFACIFWDDSSSWQGGTTCVGHWNEVGSHEGEFGTYHHKATYNEDSVTIERTLPNGTIENWVSSVGFISPPYTFAFISRTGHDGLLHADYDNVEICTEQEEPPEPSLEERVEELELKIEELEGRISWLEEMIDGIVEFIETLPRGLNQGWNT